MTPALLDMTRALNHAIRHQVDVAPPEAKDHAAQNARLELADVRERLLTVESDGEAVTLVHRWITVLAS